MEPGARQVEDGGYWRLPAPAAAAAAAAPPSRRYGFNRFYGLIRGGRGSWGSCRGARRAHGCDPRPKRTSSRCLVASDSRVPPPEPAIAALPPARALLPAWAPGLHESA